MKKIDADSFSMVLAGNESTTTKTTSVATDHFEIHTLEWFCRNRLDPDKEINKSLFYELLWIRNGAGIISTTTGDYPVTEKSVYCLSPGQLQHIDLNGSMNGYYISVSADLFYTAETEFNFSFLNTSIQEENLMRIAMDEEIQNDAEEILIKMRTEFTNYFSLRLEILKGLFKIFLLYLSRKIAARGQSSKHTRNAVMTAEFMRLLHLHVATKKMVADYASELCVTPSYLNQVVKKVSGFTASHHIQQYVIQEAKRQAIHSNRSMKEIAYGLGFDDIAHFSKFFKTNSGINFTSFKKRTFYIGSSY